MDADRLAEIAAQLAGRVRDDSPEANARWLTAVLPDPADWFRLCFALAVAVPDDRSWASLTRWTKVWPDTPEKIAERRRSLVDALKGAPGRNAPRDEAA